MAKADIFPLFSQPVYVSEVDVDMKPYVYKDIPLKEFYESDAQQTKHNIVSIDQQILDSEKYRDLRKEGDAHVHRYVFDILKVSPGPELKLVNSWLLINMPGAQTTGHVHRNAFVSGVVYIQANQNSGDISFSVPSVLPTWTTPTLKPNISEHNIYNSNEFTLKPRDGMILIFPGHTQHGVSQNLSDQHRYCIAFNYYLTGKVCSDNTSVLTL